MAKNWFSDSYTQLKSEFSENVNISYQESHAKNIYEKYFVLDKNGSLVNTSIYGENDRIIQEWLSTVLHGGTKTDRVLALAFMIREKPLNSLRHLDSLLSFVSPVKKQLCLKAIDILSNLFETLLPSSRALIAFQNRPFKILSKHPSALTEELTLKSIKHGSSLPHGCREHILTLWYFENGLKQCYNRFLTSLENVLISDTIVAEKTKALSALIRLTTKKPESRNLAISIVVNKLGDRSKGFASSVIHKLRIMCQSYQHLITILVEQIRAFIFRPNLLSRAKYYAIVLLSCIPLSKKKSNLLAPTEDADANGDSVAAVLFRIYLSFFRASVDSEELPERLIVALLTGTSRVAPYLSEEVISKTVTDIDAVFRLVHVTTNFTISLQALSFLFQFTSHQQQLRDRYYQALYRKLADPAIRWSARGSSLLNLLYQSLMADTDIERRAAIIQRLLSVCLSHPNSGFIAGSLILFGKLLLVDKVNPIGAAPGQPIELPKDPARLLPTSIGIVKPSHHTNEDSSDEEHFSDVGVSDEDENDEGEEETLEAKVKETSEKFAEGVWEHRRLLMRTKKQSGGIVAGYDDSARDPRFAHALDQPFWHLLLLANHAHPTAAYFAKSLVDGKVSKYTGDPFEDLSVAHFMERFVYKKPKPVSSKAATKPDKLIPNAKLKERAHAKGLAPDSLAYKNLNAEQVPSDERFIHSYFNFINARPSKGEVGRDSDESDLDEDFDEYLRKHEKALIPNDRDEDDENDDADFNYSTDEDEDAPDLTAETRKKGKANAQSGWKAEAEEEENNLRDDESVDTVDSDEVYSGDEDDDDDDDFAPSTRSKSGKFDLNRLFVSAEEVGDLYDNQEAPEAKITSKRSKWSRWSSIKIKRNPSQSRKKRKLQRKGYGGLSVSKKRRSC